MKTKSLLFPLAATVAILTAFGLTGCTGENTDGDAENNTHVEHVFDKQVVEDKYLKSEADCTHKAVYYFSCECGEAGTETFESGELGEHVYENGVCTVCNEPDPSVIKKTVTKEEWENALDITNYDNIELILASVGSQLASEDNGVVIRIDGSKAYYAFMHPTLDSQSELGFTYELDKELEIYFSDINDDEFVELYTDMSGFTLMYGPLYDDFTYDEQDEEYIFECTEFYESELGEGLTISEGDVIKISFENGRLVKIVREYSSGYVFGIFNYGGVEIVLPE